MPCNGFLGGVVEGFYGPPWTPGQRLQLFDSMRAWGLNTYFYAPKDDLKHRALWREDYDTAELDAMRALIRAARERSLNFIYGLSPGLDIRYSKVAERERIQGRIAQLLHAGCDHFALLFDDLPGALHPDDQERFASVADAQATLANAVRAWLGEQRPQARFLFCPTPYCDRMARWQLGGAGYLDVIGARLDPAIDVLWTGPEIVSREIPVASIRALQARIRRPPVLWDNLHANDYDGRRLFCGPYAGRTRELLDHVRGILSNPNTEYPVNYVPLRTLAGFLSGHGTWEPRAAYLEAMREWLTGHQTVREPIPLEDLVLLGDAYYLPHETGPEAERMVALLGWLVREEPAAWGDAFDQFLGINRRVQSLFQRLTELRHRELFYAWSRRAWELKEELQLFEAWLTARRAHPHTREGYGSEDHLPGTYRGGLVARLQQFLMLNDAGRFVAARPRAAETTTHDKPPAP
jgi:protein O-GlcNAcase / histone acetyltransferase